MTEVNVRKIGSVDKALRILKRKLEKEGSLKDVNRRRFFEKPSTAKYRRKKRAKYVAKLQAEEDRLYR